MRITPIVLAGGSGTRLWPLSRKSYPKQFSNIFKKSEKLRFWALFGLRFGFLAKNNVGLRPPDLKRPTGGDFSSVQGNFDESCKLLAIPQILEKLAPMFFRSTRRGSAHPFASLRT